MSETQDKLTCLHSACSNATFSVTRHSLKRTRRLRAPHAGSAVNEHLICDDLPRMRQEARIPKFLDPRCEKVIKTGAVVLSTWSEQKNGPAAAAASFFNFYAHSTALQFKRRKNFSTLSLQCSLMRIYFEFYCCL
jgi:hypothetical protein